MNDDRKPQPGDDEYVGYRCPPKKNQFQPGASGNPGGRPKEEKPSSQGESMAAILARVLDEKQTVEMRGRRKRMSQLEVAIRSLARRAMNSDRSMKLLKDLMEKAEVASPDAGYIGPLVVGPSLTSEEWEAIYGGPKKPPPFPLLDKLRAELFGKDEPDDGGKV